MPALRDQLQRTLSEQYILDREVGRGGMATVFLARDTRHQRHVALKVLDPELGAVLGAERFLSEIRVTANLQHPNLLPLFDSGQADGLLYYVMPYVEGESLRARLDREKQLPIDDAVRIATAVANALDYAHAHGVIHRDLKPENILLQHGQPVVADFGIALAVSNAGGTRVTQTGLSLGTPQYMSPEQATGDRVIDARTDIYSLAAMTYEMLCGEPPHTGTSAQAIIAKLMTTAPQPVHILRPSVPPDVAASVERGLAKLPADRFASAREFAIALSDRGAPGTTSARRATVQPSLAWRSPLVIGLTALAAALAIATTVLARRLATTEEPFPIRVEITGAVESVRGLGPGVSEDPTPRGTVVLSPDGRSVVFGGPAPDGGPAVLYLRRLDQLTGRVIPGTTTAQSPVFSPDGKSIAFIGGRRRVIKVPVDGGSAVELTNVADDGGIDWSTRNEIIMGSGVMEGLLGLSRVNATSGGTPAILTRVDTTRHELSHNFPRVLDDGRTVLFSIWYGALETAELGITSVDDGVVTPLGVRAAKALGVVDGHLLYVRPDGMVMAARIDVGARRILGSPIPLQNSVRLINASDGDAAAFVTHAGGLAFAQGSMKRRLVWVDRSGAARPVLEDEREFVFARISPDGRQVAVNFHTGARADNWLLDLATRTLTPLTTVGSARNPVWSGDGKRILFVSTQGGRSAIWQQAVDGSGAATKIADTPHNAWNLELAPDGNQVVFNAIYDGTFNLETMTLDSRERRDVSALPNAIEAAGRVSPDGKHVAYVSDESGRPEVYVRTFPDGAARVQISADGGSRPVWSRDGRRLYWLSQGRMMEGTLARDPALRVASRAVLFQGRYDREFDVSPDGSRFLMIEPRGSDISLIVIPNWLTELRRLTRETR